MPRKERSLILLNPKKEKKKGKKRKKERSRAKQMPKNKKNMSTSGRKANSISLTKYL